MKIVHFCTYPGRGGAGTAANRIHTKIRGLIGWDSHIVGAVRTDGATTKLQKIFFAFNYRLDRILSYGAQRNEWSFGLIGRLGGTSRKILKEADIACLYWTSHGFLGVLQIAYILRIKKKVVWRLSDMWVFTGGCHYSNGCERFSDDCGYCPALKSNRKWDRSRLLMKMKKLLWNTQRLKIICPSSWMADKAKGSSLLGSAAISVIHTGVDVGIFRPVGERVKGRKKVAILFIADGGLRSTRKGGGDVRKINDRLKEWGVKNYEIKVAGILSGYEKADGISELGFIKNTEDLVKLYTTSDFLLAPYREDNLPNTVIEAMSCALATVCYDIGGIRDIVKHNQTGLLASAYSIDEITEHCITLINKEELSKKLGSSARKLVLDKFNLDIQVEAFCKLIIS